MLQLGFVTFGARDINKSLFVVILRKVVYATYPRSSGVTSGLSDTNTRSPVCRYHPYSFPVAQ
jgi:hypothetical protein